MNWRPLGDRVLATPIEREDVTKSGIVLPDTANKRSPRRAWSRLWARAAFSTTAPGAHGG
jgi:Chaperonin 10 Kd subunit